MMEVNILSKYVCQPSCNLLILKMDPPPLTAELTFLAQPDSSSSVLDTIPSTLFLLSTIEEDWVRRYLWMIWARKINLKISRVT